MVRLPQEVLGWIEDKERENEIEAYHYNEALAMLSKIGDVNGCVRIVRGMLSRGMRVHRTTMNTMIAACAKAGDAEAAERWWQQMQSMGQVPNRATYASVIHAWARAGDMKKAEEWLIAMKEAGFTPAKNFCRPIAQILLDVGRDDEVCRADRASEWLVHLQDLGVPLDRSTINFLMSVYARNAEAEKAEQWIFKMNQARVAPNQATFSALILAHTRAGNAEQAKEWLTQMQQRGFDADKDDDNEARELCELLASSTKCTQRSTATNGRQTAPALRNSSSDVAGATPDIGAAHGKSAPSPSYSLSQGGDRGAGWSTGAPNVPADAIHRALEVAAGPFVPPHVQAVVARGRGAASLTSGRQTRKAQGGGKGSPAQQVDHEKDTFEALQLSNRLASAKENRGKQQSCLQRSHQQFPVTPGLQPTQTLRNGSSSTASSSQPQQGGSARGCNAQLCNEETEAFDRAFEIAIAPCVRPQSQAAPARGKGARALTNGYPSGKGQCCKGLAEQQQQLGCRRKVGAAIAPSKLGDVYAWPHSQIVQGSTSELDWQEQETRAQVEILQAFVAKHSLGGGASKKGKGRSGVAKGSDWKGTGVASTGHGRASGACALGMLAMPNQTDGALREGAVGLDSTSGSSRPIEPGRTARLAADVASDMLAQHGVCIENSRAPQPLSFQQIPMPMEFLNAAHGDCTVMRGSF